MQYHLLFNLLSALAAHLASPTSALSQSPSLLAGTRWRARLDVGLLPGTAMPERYPGWAASGGRLGFDVDLEFTANKSPAETLAGRGDAIYQLSVLRRPSFVSERGLQEVDLGETGGWYIQRPEDTVEDSEGNPVDPGGTLRFWLDCSGGAVRNDVEIFPGSRLLFSAGVWDNPTGAERLDGDYRAVLAELETAADAARGQREGAAKKNMWEELRSLQRGAQDAERIDRLTRRKDALEDAIPPPGSPATANGVRIAAHGSLVMKDDSTPGWLPGSRYLKLGTFSSKALGADGV